VGGYSVQHYDGNAWTETASSMSYLYGVWGTSSGAMYAVGDRCTILRGAR
jgi:hypothetical protein